MEEIYREEKFTKKTRDFMECMGITDDEKVVSIMDLEEREEFEIWQVHMKSSWNSEGNW